MNAQAPVQNKSAIPTALLGLLALLLIASVLAGLNTQLPLINTDRAALIVLAVLGIAMCTTGGIGVTVAKRGWADVVSILGSVLGVLALALVALVLLGVRLPLIATDRDAVLALAGIGVVKVVIEAADHLRK